VPGNADGDDKTAPPGSTDSDPAAVEGVGQVIVSSRTILYQGNVIGRDSGVTAFFARFGGAGAGACTRTKIDACTVLECTGNGDAWLGNAGGTSFGNVTVKGGTRAVALATAGGRYTPDVDAQHDLFVPGESLTLEAPGDPNADSPAFRETLVAPKPLSLTAPAFVPGENLDVPKSGALNLAWTKGSAGSEITATLEGQVTGMYVRTACFFDGALGAATIPTAVLAKVSQGEGILTVESSTTRSIAPQLAPRGAWNIMLALRTQIASMRIYLH
jgi:hypothetical protein